MSGHTPEPSEKDTFMAALLDNASSQLAQKDAALTQLQAERDEALDALAEANAAFNQALKLNLSDVLKHIHYGLEPAQAILRKHGRLA